MNFAEIPTVWGLLKEAPVKKTKSDLAPHIDYQAIFNAASNGMALTHAETDRIVDVNVAWTRTTGITRANALGKTVSELGVTHLVSGQIISSHADRHVLWEFRDISVERKASDALHSDGKVLCGSGTMQDITAQQNARQELTQSQVLLQSIIASVPVRIFWKDKDSRYLGCNPIFARDAGKTNPTEVIGKLDYDMGWAAQADLYRADDRQVMESGIPRLNFEEPQTTPDGRTIYLRTSKVPLKDEKNNVIGILGIYEDVTERKHAATQLKESEERFRSLFNASRDAIYLHDGPTIVDCNPAALTLLGITDRADIIGKTPARRAAHDPADSRDASTRAAERIRAALHGIPQQFEWVARRNDGSEALLDVQLDRVDIGGRPYVQAIARDITQRRKAEIALREERLVRETILDAIPGISYALDKNGFLRFWSHSFEHVTGRSADELMHFNVLIGFTSRNASSGCSPMDEVMQRPIWWPRTVDAHPTSLQADASRWAASPSWSVPGSISARARLPNGNCACSTRNSKRGSARTRLTCKPAMPSCVTPSSL